MRSGPLCAVGQERVSMEGEREKETGSRREGRELHVFVSQPTVDLVGVAPLVPSVICISQRACQVVNHVNNIYFWFPVSENEAVRQ